MISVRSNASVLYSSQFVDIQKKSAFYQLCMHVTKISEGFSQFVIKNS